MNNVVNRLLDADKQARMILDEAQQYYDRTVMDIDAEKQKITAKYEQKANKHLEEIKRAEESSVKEAFSEIRARYSSLTAEIDKVFETKHVEWEDELFNKCVGR